MDQTHIPWSFVFPPRLIYEKAAAFADGWHLRWKRGRDNERQAEEGWIQKVKKNADQETAYKQDRKKGVKKRDDIENPHASSQHHITAHRADRLVSGWNIEIICL